MEHLRVVSILLLLLLPAGCVAKAARNSIDHGQLDVFGVAMFSSTDHREIRGVRGVDEPCLRGVDRSFDSLDIVIGYDSGGKIRKIASRNPDNSMFGVHPGETVVSALEKIRGAGFVTSGSPYRFRKGGLALTILTDGTGRLFGITLEAVDQPDTMQDSLSQSPRCGMYINTTHHGLNAKDARS